MKTAAVVLENWKIPTFKKHLDAAGYAYTEHPGPLKDSITLRVSYAWVHLLKPVIDTAQTECRMSKMVKP